MENIVSVDGLNIDLPDRRLFENLAFDIPRGALTCITGENGVGKTTLVKHLLRDLKTNSHNILLNLLLNVMKLSICHKLEILMRIIL